MSPSYELVKFSPELTPQVAALQTHLWHADLSRNHAYFEWKYVRNPYAGQPRIYLAMHGDEAVGMRGMFGARWSVADREVDIPCACDFVIAPAHRNQGLAKRIMDFALADLATAGYPCVLNLSGSRVTQLLSLGMGWRRVGDLETLARCRPEPRLMSSLKHAVRKVGPLAGFYRWVRRGAGHAGRARTQSFERFDRLAARATRDGIRVVSAPEPEGMAHLTCRVARHDRIRHVRDRAYFAWRYLNPLVTYRFLCVGHQPLDGYLVLATQARAHRGPAVVNVADVCALDPAIEARLLDAVIAGEAFEAVHVWGATLSGPTRALLADRGFRAAEKPVSMAHLRPALMAKALSDRCDWRIGATSLLDMAHWDLRMIDSDGV